MKRILVIILSLIFFVISCSTSEKDPDTITVATAGDMPPFSYYNQDNELVGYDIGIAEEIGKRLGKKVEYNVVPFSRFVPLLLSNRVDMVISSLDNQDPMKKIISFTNDYMYAITFFAVKEGTPIDSFYEVHGTPMLIGVTNGTTAAKLLRSQGLEDNIRIYPTKTDLYMALNTNKITGILAYEDELNYLKKKLDAQALKGQVFKLKRVDNAIGDHHLSIAINKNNKALLAKVNKIIKEMKEDGTISAIGLKWLGREPFPRYSEQQLSH